MRRVKKAALWFLGVAGFVGVLSGLGTMAQQEKSLPAVAPASVVEPDIAKFIAHKLSDKAWLKSGSVDREHITYLTFTPAGEVLMFYRLKNNKAAWVVTIDGSRRRPLTPQLFGFVRQTCRQEGSALTTTYFKIEAGPVVGSVLQFQQFSNGDQQAVLTNAAYLGSGDVDPTTRRCAE